MLGKDPSAGNNLDFQFYFHFEEKKSHFYSEQLFSTDATIFKKKIKYLMGSTGNAF